jgi:hypothetical protein
LSILLESIAKAGGRLKMSMSGMQYKMEQRLIRKFEKAGAISMEKAVTIEEANLDEEEQYWLDYFAGSFLGKIKKTRQHLYYI